ncbi:hypothetical protein M1M24_gp43 [Polaribacter phage Freya_1]|uniref:Uncharacterized protein n=1 Tax=Polaribacter phage Freya_1 TaxID=2745662 RepID=A0A8E4ZFY1_9CAUD|nr:hypothetical protein M1M24_gp43 [Polaribacter phage Freya_1]QQV90980.1 hypothetical protein Freya2_43 [Polaribacter phage Freya_2]QQV91048.1 hypothetical protein Freya3_43 [Polaribacter phage Freya_3]QQV91116.1 hypothetical protein Freya4_43 [Polaribacter phage Freya_4]QQV91191.1 hypothetical protein Freya8_50 [Polaribacter phage Freya_8]QQV91268.1 hypothetical protein Freya9_52 [Polaribacter phage Freya_9]QQV91346.1 hypothetical protein Freya10_53 [Polaribacter phage Freya_10]QYV99925.1 
MSQTTINLTIICTSVIVLSVIFIAYFLIKNSKTNEGVFKVLQSRHIIQNKESYSKIEIQKAQQFLDNNKF